MNRNTFSCGAYGDASVFPSLVSAAGRTACGRVCGRDRVAEAILDCGGELRRASGAGRLAAPEQPRLRGGYGDTFLNPFLPIGKTALVRSAWPVLGAKAETASRVAFNEP